MRRRNLLTLLGIVVLAAPLVAAAQGAGQLPRVGFLGNSTAALEANLVAPFRVGLRDLGYVEGENVQKEFRWAEGDYARFPALITELAALHVDVIVTAGTPATLALKKATSSIPVVMIASGRPGPAHHHATGPACCTGTIRTCPRPDAPGWNAIWCRSALPGDVLKSLLRRLDLGLQLPAQADRHRQGTVPGAGSGRYYQVLVPGSALTMKVPAFRSALRQRPKLRLGL